MGPRVREIIYSKLLQKKHLQMKSLDAWVVLTGEIICAQFATQIHSSDFVDEAYFGLSSSIRLMKSGFSRQPSQDSSQSLRIFFKSRTLSFFRSTVFKSICLSTREVYLITRAAFFYVVLPYLRSQIWWSFFLSFSQILSAGIDQLSGFDISPKIPVADSSNPPR